MVIAATQKGNNIPSVAVAYNEIEPMLELGFSPQIYSSFVTEFCLSPLSYVGGGCIVKKGGGYDT